MKRFSFLLLVLLACSKDKDAPQFGEAIGANTEAKGNVPALSVALAVTKGNDPVTFLPKLVGAVSNAVGSCPAFVTEEKDAAALHFSVIGGKMKVTTQPTEAGRKCVASALEGKEIGPPTATGVDGRVEIKVGGGAAKAP